ncbi:pyruvate kinase 2, cytosolic-like isoform X2 [Punica granatum]|uniref:Pyruvate kinase n=1 Tax=Punica granatum TaxID=22663 RepID=A0A6P8C5T2_PUNGR|nr:pyruvate kinase 2, cytosolic-like isoform X2 [Punica granatum]
MQGGQMIVEENAQLSTVLTSSAKPSYIPSLTKIIATLGPKSRSVDTIEACLKAGMSGARFDFSWLDGDYHQETLENLRIAMKNAKKLCAIMLDTVGPELQVCNTTGNPIDLKADTHVTITSNISKEASAEVLPVDYAEFPKIVKKGDTVFLGQHLFTGHETSSVWLEVLEIKGENVICLVKNTASLSGSMITVCVSNVKINLATLTEKDKQIISTWGVKNNIDIISLSYTRHVEDVRELRAFLKMKNLSETQIYAKVETTEGLRHFDEILQEADGIIFGRGNLGIDLPPEKVFLFQKYAISKCNMVGKPVIVTRVVDSMTGNLRPTRAEATDVANAVLDGADGIMLGAETLRGLYPVDAVRTVGRICAEAEHVYNHTLHYKKIVKHVGEPMTHAESVASSAVRSAIKVKAATIVVFTSSGRAARPPVPIVAIVIPHLRANSLKWTFTGSSQARQLLGVRGIYPILASPDVAAPGSEESGLRPAIDHGRSAGFLKSNDRIVVFQKVGNSSVAKIVELQQFFI